MSEVLVDTNILVYSADQDSMFFERSRALLESPDFELATTSKDIAELLVVLTKSTGYNLDNQLALEVLDGIRRNMRIIYPDQKSLDILSGLIRLYDPKGLRIHDMEIIAISLAHDINLVATFNVKDFKSVNEIKLLDL
ncbi:MAG: PIN domain-containing protein [Cyclobacteriaceae bacterium]